MAHLQRVERRRRERNDQQDRLHAGVPQQSGIRSGSVSVTWSITLSGESLRAGTHQVALRWRVDTVVP